MTNSLIVTGQFVLEIVFNIYILFIMLRFLLQWVKADFYNPICQFLIKVTNPLLIPLRRIIPGLFGLDMASVVLMYLLQVAFLVLSALMLQESLTVVILVKSIVGLLLFFFETMFYAILLRAIASWFNPNPYNPLLIILIQLTEPLLLPFRKRLPTFSGIDFSPLVVLILIQVVIVFVSNLFGMA